LLVMVGRARDASHGVAEPEGRVQRKHRSGADGREPRRSCPPGLRAFADFSQLQGAIAILEQEDSALLTALRTIVQALAVGCRDCVAKQSFREALVRGLERAKVEGEP